MFLVVELWIYLQRRGRCRRAREQGHAARRFIPGKSPRSPRTHCLTPPKDCRRTRRLVWWRSTWTRQVNTYYIDQMSKHTFLGRQHLGALFNLVAYYVLALPMGITLAFHPRTHMGLQGLWLGKRSQHLGEAAISLFFGAHRSSRRVVHRWLERICDGLARH